MRGMKLAEALKMRSDLDLRLRQLEIRLNNNSKVQEGDEPSEDPKVLLAELDTITEQLMDLIRRINITNSLTKDRNGATLAELLARRDVMKRKGEMLRTFIDHASNRAERRVSTDIKIVSTVDVKALRKQADRISEDVRKTDNSIQELNWITELI
jgi:tRNA C32,U32 (ribose-2'-O)-methylase TrmJ